VGCLQGPVFLEQGGVHFLEGFFFGEYLAAFGLDAVVVVVPG